VKTFKVVFHYGFEGVESIVYDLLPEERPKAVNEVIDSHDSDEAIKNDRIYQLSFIPEGLFIQFLTRYSFLFFLSSSFLFFFFFFLFLALVGGN
jgi:hypothetical protein